MPALQTTASSRPNRSIARERRRGSRLVGDVGLDGHGRSRPAAELRRQPGLRQIEAATHQPASSRCCAMARPMPFAAPVTSATGWAWALRAIDILGRDRQVGPAAPFGPGAVVEHLRRLADASSANQSVAAVTPEPQLVMSACRDRHRLRRSLGDHAPARSAGRLRSVRSPGRCARPACGRSGCLARLGRLAAEARGRPGVHHLGALVHKRHLHVVDTGDHRGVSSASNLRGVRWRRRCSSGRPSACHFGRPPSRM